MDSRDPYAGADLSTSRRFQTGLLGLCGLLTLTFLPFEPVEQIGDAGWAIAAGLGVLAIATAVLILRREPSVLWLGTGAPHPPRSAIPHLAVMVAALALPLAYADIDSETVDDMAAEALILVVCGSLLTAYQARIRRQRAGLEAGVQVERRLAHGRAWRRPSGRAARRRTAAASA